ncbi:MAG: hypothetical protein HY698_04085 [Deltaproteobacteria bacterium]|nr:hypothetical protein [Deltaproteobacteria bacterium]
MADMIYYMELHRTVTEFFHDAVTNALKSQDLEVKTATEFYLVNLLAEFTHASHVGEEPLALKLVTAQEGTPDERIRALRDIGDTSLYVSGFFADSLTRKLIDVDYYIAMGRNAYTQLAGIVTSSRGSAPGFFQEAFHELADKFRSLVEVLHAIRAKTNFSTGTDMVRLYEEWLRTGSEWIERRLRATGLFSLDAVGPGKLVH